MQRLAANNSSSSGNTMSRIGKNPVKVPAETEASFAGGVFTAKGPKGTISRAFKDDVSLTIAEGQVVLAPARESDLARALWGTYAAHVGNMLEGVSLGFKKVMEIQGVGYRAEVKGSNLQMQLGYSHPIIMEIPQGLTVTVEKGVMTVSGVDKEVVGQFAANVRSKRKPEPYKGKGIRYQGEFVLRKQGKKAT